MQHNLDFKYGAGQKRWRVGGSLGKKQKDCCEKAVSVGKSYILCNVDDKLNKCIYLFGCGCVSSATKSFFSSLRENPCLLSSTHAQPR
jgi:hypothetical protein